MNKLKGLKEKRNDLVSKQKTMLSTAIDETRSLTEEEDTELRSVIEQIKELETEIETMEEEIRTSTIVINDENDKGEDKMTKTYEEIRSEFIDGLSVPNKELAKTEVRTSVFANSLFGTDNPSMNSERISSYVFVILSSPLSFSSLITIVEVRISSSIVSISVSNSLICSITERNSVSSSSVRERVSSIAVESIVFCLETKSLRFSFKPFSLFIDFLLL